MLTTRETKWTKLHKKTKHTGTYKAFLPKIVFLRSILLLKTVTQVQPQCTTDHTYIYSREQLSIFNYRRNVFLYLILFFLSLNIYASDYYITNSDLNLRAGPGTNYKSIMVLSKGDTVELLNDTGSSWVKIQYQEKVGYSAKQYLQKIQIDKTSQENIEESESSSIPPFFIGLFILIFVVIVLTQIGKKHRNLSFAKFLSFFFGTVGLQKYYLGKTNQGTLSIMFCWTFIPTIIGIVDFAKLASMSEENFNIKFNGFHSSKLRSIKRQEKQKVKQTVTRRPEESFKNISLNSYKDIGSDKSIIDVNSENFDLSIDYPVQNNEVQFEPPFWSHSYVYSYDEINYASKAQKRFYFYFREKVLKNEFVDIKGNTNYAFILYFDLLNEYENHRDIKLLEEQFKLLGQICPKTKSYSLMSLQDLLRKRTDSYSLEKLNNLQEPSYQFEHGYSDYDPDAYKLGKQYKDKLDLNKQEVAWLNKFWNPSNVFISIEGCCIATIKQYLLILKNLNKKLKTEETSIAKEVDYFKEKIFEIKEIADSYWGYYDKSYMKQRVESEIYLTVFKRVENSVREFYGHKRKVGNNPYYEFEGEFENRIGRHVDELVDKYKGEIVNPDIETQIELNAQNVNRWKTEFTNLKDLFQKNEINKFIEGVIALEETNQKNPNIENIFFEASKFIAKYDKVQSLKYYAKYIYYDLKSVKFDNKELTKTVQKSLFKSQEQINDFKRIIAELIETSDIEKALGEISKIYIPKRKKIELDKSKIKEVERKHDGTVELLNEYLETDNDDFPKDETFDNEGIEIDIITPEHNNSIFMADIRMGKVQEELVKRFIANSFAIHQDEVDKFAIDNGMFKNQLIDSINEACSEHLDGEPLIEEDNENYVIEESYFKEIAV